MTTSKKLQIIELYDAFANDYSIEDLAKHGSKKTGVTYKAALEILEAYDESVNKIKK